MRRKAKRGQDWWIKTPRRLLVHWTGVVGKTAILVYETLLVHADQQRCCWPSYASLTTMLHIGRSNLAKALLRLKDSKLIEIELVRVGGRRARNVYKVLDLPEIEEAMLPFDDPTSVPFRTDRRSQIGPTVGPIQDRPSVPDRTDGGCLLSIEQLDPPQLDPAQNAVEVVEFAALWNAAEGVQPAQADDPILRAKIRERMGDSFFAAHWREALAKVATSAFCCGAGPSGWRADVWWFLEPASLSKILSGRYARSPPPKPPPPETLDQLRERRIRERAERLARERETARKPGDPPPPSLVERHEALLARKARAPP